MGITLICTSWKSRSKWMVYFIWKKIHLFFLEKNAIFLTLFLSTDRSTAALNHHPVALRLLFLVNRSAKSNWIRSSKVALKGHIYCLRKKLDSVFCWQLPAFPVSSFIFYVSFVSSLLLPASSCQSWDSITLTLPLPLSLIADLCLFQLSSTSLSQSLSIQFPCN